ncbi:MAG: hypothetical protein KDC82_03610 [Bacteroidetes bacterium]|nr:hypothetical protein [Bacteroidota bacterium]
MGPILLIRCKVNVYASIGMIIFGLAALAISAWLIIIGYSLWWLILTAFGLFCILNWTKILLDGSRTLVFYIQNGWLYFSFEKSKKIVAKLDEIEKGEYYSSKFELAEVEKFWRHIYISDGNTHEDELWIKYQGEKVKLADLHQYESKLSDKDLLAIAHFLKYHQPKLSLGK